MILFFLENIQTRVLLLRHRKLLEVPKSGGELKVQEIHLKSNAKPMVIIGVCILIIINKFVMISRSCRQRPDDWRWPLGLLLAVTSGYTHAARSIPTQTQPGRTHTNTHKCTSTNPDPTKPRPNSDTGTHSKHTHTCIDPSSITQPDLATKPRPTAHQLHL